MSIFFNFHFDDQYLRYFFQILWKNRGHILVTFLSHLKKLRSKLRFWLEKLNCGFFYSFHSWKNTRKQLFLHDVKKKTHVKPSSRFLIHSFLNISLIKWVAIVIFYTEILMIKVVLWCFFMSETSEKIHNSTFRVKISV